MQTFKEVNVKIKRKHFAFDCCSLLGFSFHSSEYYHTFFLLFLSNNFKKLTNTCKTVNTRVSAVFSRLVLAFGTVKTIFYARFWISKKVAKLVVNLTLLIMLSLKQYLFCTKIKDV